MARSMVLKCGFRMPWCTYYMITVPVPLDLGRADTNDFDVG